MQVFAPQPVIDALRLDKKGSNFVRMTDKPDTKPAERVEVTADSLDAIAAQLADFRDAYVKAAAEMREKGIATIKLKGVANLLHWMDRVGGAKQSLENAMMDTRLQALRTATAKPDSGRAAESAQKPLAERDAARKAARKKKGE